MNLSYRTLEKEYYKEMHAIAASISQDAPIISNIDLPYFLEKETLAKLKQNSCWIISAISGTGKTTISEQFISRGFKKLPNVTTRPKRPEEKNNDCVFISNSSFTLWKNNGLLFYPHKRNGVWQGILKKDIKKLKNSTSLIYFDKSVESAIALRKKIPKAIDFTFIYLLPPTFKELSIRIQKREYSRKNYKKALSQKEILKRFKEEIRDMKKSIKLPYVYIVNDYLPRVRKLLKESINKSSK